MEEHSGYYRRDKGDPTVKIKVIGVGGCGGNAVDYMIANPPAGVTFMAADTDMQALARSKAAYTIQLGERLTSGRGAEKNPEIGWDAALESADQIKAAIGDAHMVFVVAGMGKGTGTGAAPVIAGVARELGALTVGVVTKPFHFEGRKTQEAAERGVAEFRQHADSLITIPNDRAIWLAPKKTTFKEMLEMTDGALYSAVKGISDLIMAPGLVNLDLSDVQAVLSIPG